jgi:hypothetical protein
MMWFESRSQGDGFGNAAWAGWGITRPDGVDVTKEGKYHTNQAAADAARDSMMESVLGKGRQQGATIEEVV